MCGRYALGAAHIDFLEGLQEHYARLFPRGRDDDDEDAPRGGRPLRLRGGGVGGDDPVKMDKHVAESMGVKWEREQDFWPSYNLAPKQRAPVVRRDPATGEAMIETMQWGLIPHWTKFPPTGPLNTINARSEALIDPSSGGMWHALKGYKRCVIPAQGYYEWQKKGSTKVPNFIRLPLGKGEVASAPPLLFFAGLWDTVKYVDPVPSKWVPQEGDDREPYPTGNPIPLSTFTIITTTPAKDIAWLHDREPCVLTDEDEIRQWLDLGETPKGWIDGKNGTADLLHSYPGLDVYPVQPEVGKIGHSQQSYILPVAERKDGIKSFFAKQSPAKPKAEAATATPKAEPVTPTKAKPAAAVKSEQVSESKPLKEDVQTSSQEVKPEATPTKRKRTDEDGNERRAGHQTKIIRPAAEENKAVCVMGKLALMSQQPSITNFFKSPAKKN